MNDRIRVAMLIQGYHPRIGGAERQLASVAPLLQAQGIDVHVLTRRYPGLKPFEMINGIPVHRLPIPGPKATASLSFTATAVRLLQQLRPDVLHAHELFSPTTTAIVAKQLFGTPVVVKLLRGGIHGDLTRLKQKLLGSYRLRLFRRSIDKFIIISDELDQELAEIGVTPQQRVFIPNGVDNRRFAPTFGSEKRALRASLQLGDGPVVVFAGRLAHEKRVDQLLRVWPVIHAQHPSAQLLILGTGPEEKLLHSLASAGVDFRGAVEDVAPFLRAADLFVLPSVAEGLSNSLLEAMAAGLAVIATEVGGAPDLIDHQANGWLIPSDRPELLQAGLLALMDDPERRTQFARAARDRVAHEYALPVVASRLCSLYQQLVNHRSVAAEPTPDGTLN